MSKGLTDEELRQILEDMSDIEYENGTDDDGEWSEEDEIITTEKHNSASEIELEDNEQTSVDEASDSDMVIDEDNLSDDTTDNFYIGRNKKTKWRKTSYHSKTSKCKSKNIIKVFPGPKGAAKDVSTETEAFSKLIDDSIINDVMLYTNMYTSRNRRDVTYSRERDRKNTSKTEIMAVLGMLFLIGTKKASRTNVKELWTNDGTGLPILRACMSYKRFLFLLRSIRFDDKETREDRKKFDKLAAIRVILDKFEDNCKKYYNHSEFITIDEKLEPFRGRCSFVQYIPNKPAKYGLKIFALSDAKTYYTSAFEVYCGKQPEGPYCKSNSPSDVVERLTKHVKGTNRNLTTDNWYTSYPLACSMLKQKITMIGTLRKNKAEIPPQFLPHKDRVVGSSSHGFQKEVSLVSYVPKKSKAVVLLSTMHNEEEIDEITGKPQIILDYNMTKGGVDTVDQLCSGYSVSRTTRRWPLALFYALLNVAGINAQILFTSNIRNQKTPRRSFLKNLAMQLMKPHLVERSKISTLPSDIQLFLKHYKPVEEEQTQEKQRKKRGRCTTCGRQKNKFTSTMCDKCGQFVCQEHSNTTITCDRCKYNFETRDESD